MTRDERRRLIAQKARKSARTRVGDSQAWLSYAERQLTVLPKHRLAQSELSVEDMAPLWNSGETLARTDFKKKT